MKMKEQLEKLIQQLEKIDERLDNVDKTLVKQEANLAEHMRRTVLLENQMEPVRTHVAMVSGAGKLLGVTSLVVTVVVGVIKIFN